MQRGQSSQTSPSRIIAANRIQLRNEKAQRTGMKFNSKHQDVSGPSLPGYSVDALYVPGKAEWWHPGLLMKTNWRQHTQPRSLTVFLSPLYHNQHSAAFIQLTHEETLHNRKIAARSDDWKNS